MLPEPLKNKKIDIPKYKNVYPEKAVESAVQFYKIYKNDVKKLMDDHNKIWKEYIKYYNNLSNITKKNHLEKYNDWLFSYAFSDVVQPNEEFW